jgi:hypothetical protein
VALDPLSLLLGGVLAIASHLLITAGLLAVERAYGL